MSDIMTMIFVLGGTLAGAMALLYFSLLSGSPRKTAIGKKREAEEAAIALAASDRRS